MPTPSSRPTATQKKHPQSTHQAYFWLTAVSVLLLVGLAISAVFLQKNLRQSQDWRRAASVASGSAHLLMENSILEANQPAEIPLQLSINPSTTVDLVNLNFQLTTSQANMVTDLNVSPGNSGWSIHDLVISKISNQIYKFDFRAIPQASLNPITNAAGFIKITLRPVLPGTLNFDFDSSSTVINGTQDILQSVPRVSIEVAEAEIDPTLACEAPANLTVEYHSCEANAGTATITWQGISVANSETTYTLTLARNSTFTSGVKNFTTTATTVDVKDLDSGDWYARVQVSKASSCQITNQKSALRHFEIDCQQECEYIYNNDWGSCNNGWQEQTYQVIGANCPAPSWESYHRQCLAQCQYDCPEWPACTVSKLQNRTCSATNTPCFDYTGQNRQTSYIEQRYCQVVSTELNQFVFGSYQSCWDDENNGSSAYLAWSTDRYPDVTWIDISAYSDFSEFAHKEISDDNTDEEANDYLLTNGKNFHWADDNDNFTFRPDTTYYARLYYRTDDNNHGHSRTISFRISQCDDADDDLSYQDCNESCHYNSECADGLFCYQNQCRLTKNPGNEYCYDPTAKKSCAEWCADSNECQTGLTCWYNYCRNPKNINVSLTTNTDIALDLAKERQNQCRDYSTQLKKQSTYLIYTQTTNPVVTTQTKGQVVNTSYTGNEIQTVGCNEACQSNRNCGANYRCYQGACRLASNPTSQICDPNDTSSGKGANDGTQTGTDATSSGAIKPTGTSTTGIKPTAKPTSVVVEDESSSTSSDQDSWLQKIQKWFTALDLSWPIMVGFGLAGLIFLVALAAFLNSRQDEKSQLSNWPKTTPVAPASPKPATSRIANQPVAGSKPMTSQTTNYQPVSSKPAASQAPRQPARFTTANVNQLTNQPGITHRPSPQIIPEQTLNYRPSTPKATAPLRPVATESRSASQATQSAPSLTTNHQPAKPALTSNQVLANSGRPTPPNRPASLPASSPVIPTPQPEAGSMANRLQQKGIKIPK